MTNVLLLCGGNGPEHDISLTSAQYILDHLRKIDAVVPYYVEMGKDDIKRDIEGRKCELLYKRELFYPHSQKRIPLHFAIPCIHGPPGETGDIQSLFEIMGLPFLGPSAEGSRLCFNKVSTKLWLDALGITNAPFTFLVDQSQTYMQNALDFFQCHKDVFVKSAQQGSSIGVYHVTDVNSLTGAIEKSFEYSDYILLEKKISGRELEVGVYLYNDKIIATPPGEILCDSDFYDYQQKYGESNTTTDIVAKNISSSTQKQIADMALRAFNGLKLRHLARIDFFLGNDEIVYINEINTFPGHTPISMFPMMMNNQGHDYHKFLETIISQEAIK